MKQIRLSFFTAIVISSLIVTVFANAQNSIVGIWLGTLKVPGAELRIALTFSQADEGYAVTMNSIDQGSGEIPLDSVKYSDNHLIVKAPKMRLEIEGEVNFTEDIFTAEFRQGPGKFPIEFKRVDKLPAKPIIERPQTPKDPFPYNSNDVIFENKDAGVTIAGTLTTPKSGGPFPAVCLLSGSGPQDRNEEIFGHKPFLVIADHLTRHGIAVLRYDDRGVGGTTGVKGSTTEDFAKDALAAIDFLKTKSEINHSQIGLVGHSEGGMIAPIAASQSNQVAFIVLMAGPGIKFSDIILFQKELKWKQAGLSDDDIALHRLWHNKTSEIVAQDKSDEKVMNEITTFFNTLTEDEKRRLHRTAETIKDEVNGLLEPWRRYATQYDPVKTLSQLKCPILAINGEKDMQVVSEKNLKSIENTLKNSKHPNYTVKELKGLNHLFQTAETGLEDEYKKIEETFSPMALNIISDWILEITK